MWRAKSALTVLLLGVVVGCSSGGNALPGTETPAEKRATPSTPPSIEGIVTNVVRSGEKIGSIRVETRPGEAAGSPKAVARVEQSTLILLRGMQMGDFNSLEPGQWVRVWFTGPVMESYPVQARAATVVVDSTGSTGR